MEIITDNEGLKELIETGCSKSKVLRNLPKSAVKGFFKAYGILRAETRIEDLFRYKGLHYEKLTGSLSGLESVRCDLRYRLIFKSSIKEAADENAEKKVVITITRIELITISDHYGDL